MTPLSFMPTSTDYNHVPFESVGHKTNGAMCNKKDFHLFEDVENDLQSNFGDWKVMNDGAILYQGNKNCPIQNVDAIALTSVDIPHVLSRPWQDYKDANDFFFAYLEALRNAGKQSLTICVNKHNLSKVE